MKQRLQDLGSKTILQEIEECDKELNVYFDLQQIFTADYMDYCRWQQQIAYRKTLVGRLTYYLGKVIAVWYIIRLCISTKNLVYPVYNSNRISTNVHKILKFLNIYEEKDELFWQLSIQYFSLIMIGILIATNIRSFLNNLLKSIKNLLRDQLI